MVVQDCSIVGLAHLPMYCSAIAHLPMYEVGSHNHFVKPFRQQYEDQLSAPAAVTYWLTYAASRSTLTMVQRTCLTRRIAAGCGLEK